MFYGAGLHLQGLLISIFILNTRTKVQLISQPDSIEYINLHFRIYATQKEVRNIGFHLQ